MMALVLQRLEKLQADLARIDPADQHDAAEAVADMAVLVRDMLAQARVGLAPSTARFQRTALQATG